MANRCGKNADLYPLINRSEHSLKRRRGTPLDRSLLCFEAISGGGQAKKHSMKKHLLTILALCVTTAFAAETVEKTTKTTTTTTSGTLSEYTPGTTFVVKETSGPIKYRYGKTVKYVTKSGKDLSDEEVKTRIKVGVPVRVQYDLDGETRIVNRVEIDD